MKTTAKETHSKTGMMANGREYNHIEVKACEERIVRCNACDRANYERSAKDEIVPSDLKLFELRVSSNGYQTAVTHLCPECMKDLRHKLLPFSA